MDNQCKQHMYDAYLTIRHAAATNVTHHMHTPPAGACIALAIRKYRAQQQIK